MDNRFEGQRLIGGAGFLRYVRALETSGTAS
jgi:hypothetical protein